MIDKSNFTRSLHRYVPPGWSENPSSWPHRAWIAGTALAGFIIALYLALYQERLIPSVWDPFFGPMNYQILDSGLAKSWPLPDALIGALGYLAIAGLSCMAGPDRWRQHPWLVLLLGALIVGMGLIGVVLVVVQSLVYHAWCSLCLATAAISVCLIGPTMDEVLASLQHLAREGRHGHSVWRALWGFDLRRHMRVFSGGRAHVGDSH